MRQIEKILVCTGRISTPLAYFAGADRLSWMLPDRQTQMVCLRKWMPDKVAGQNVRLTD